MQYEPTMMVTRVNGNFLSPHTIRQLPIHHQQQPKGIIIALKPPPHTSW